MSVQREHQADGAPETRPAILLIGGTRETADLAQGLARGGFRVLVSVATEAPLEVGKDPHIERRSGPLDMAGLGRLITERSVIAVVDASHPYAQGIRANAAGVCESLGIRYFSWVRPRCAAIPGVPTHFVADHREAARIACAMGGPVLITTGSTNLTPYVEEASQTGVELVVRVLNSAASVNACIGAGVPQDRIITGRGPFTVEENLDVMRRFRIGVLVTKDSGTTGGFPEKMAAAKKHGCVVIVIRRPQSTESGTHETLEDFVTAVCTTLGPGTG